MELDFAFLADSADVVGGKLYVLGGAFDALGAQSLPVHIPRITLAMRFLLTPAESDRNHKIEIIVMDEDGKKLAALRGDFSASVATRIPGSRLSVPLALNFLNMRFDKFGSYSVEILVNGLSVKSIPLQVIQAQAAST